MAAGPRRPRRILLPVADLGAPPLGWAVAASLAVHLAALGLAATYPSAHSWAGPSESVETIRQMELGLWEARRGAAGLVTPTPPSAPEGTPAPASTSDATASPPSDGIVPTPPEPPPGFGPRRPPPGLWGLEAVQSEPGPPTFQSRLAGELGALEDSLALAASQPESGWGVPDGERGMLGVSASRLYLGSFSIPLRTDGQPIFSDPRDQQDPRRRIERALDERIRVQDALQDRARTMRARRDSVRSAGGR